MVELPKGLFYDEIRKLDEMHAKSKAAFLEEKGYEMPDYGPHRPSNSELIAYYEAEKAKPRVLGQREIEQLLSNR